eukprot:758283-Hanusia_phi.AAC.1
MSPIGPEGLGRRRRGLAISRLLAAPASLGLCSALSCGRGSRLGRAALSGAGSCGRALGRRRQESEAAASAPSVTQQSRPGAEAHPRWTQRLLSDVPGEEAQEILMKTTVG